MKDIDQIIARMEDAVSVVLHSEHATSKVAACLFQPDETVKPSVAVNERPLSLRPHFEWDARLGSSSQFVHAELAALARFNGPLVGAHICVTDPFCPNCAKNLAEAGVRTIYIDHKGFQKDFIVRNEGEFKSMSMVIAAKAGISVYMVNRKERAITPILEQITTTRPAPSGIEFFDVGADMTLEGAIAAFRERLGIREAWALAFIKERDGSRRGLLALEALPPGITPEDFLTRRLSDTGKYRFPVDPLTRLLIATRRMGFVIEGDVVGMSQIPSSRAQVNALEFNLKGLLLASLTPDHDATGPFSLEDLQKRSILQISRI